MKKTVFHGGAEDTAHEMQAEGLEWGMDPGRRAPMHRMHVDCIMEIIRAGLKPVIVVGSINGPESPLWDPVHNPLTVEQQKEQFRRALPGIDYNEAHMILLEDVPDDKTWMQNFARAVKDQGMDGKAVVHFRSKSADKEKANEAIKPLSAYTAPLVEAGLAVWQSYNENPADDGISASLIRKFDLDNLTREQRRLIAAADYLVSIAKAAREANPDKALLEQHHIPVTALDLSLDRMRLEAGIRTADVIAAMDGTINLDTLGNAATAAVKNRGQAPGAAKKPLLVLGDSVSTETADYLKSSGVFAHAGASIGEFGSGEPYVELFFKGKRENVSKEERHAEWLADKEKIDGAQAFVVQSTGAPVAKNIMSALLAIHTTKYYGAKDVTAVLTTSALKREDRAMEDSFWSVGAELLPKQLKAAGADGVVTFTMHSQAGIDFYKKEFGDRFVSLTATDIFAAYLREQFRGDAPNLVVGAPDGANKEGDEGQKRARELSTSLTGAFNKASMFRIEKEHVAKSETKVLKFDGDVAGKNTVVVDDIVDGGSTMVNAARQLKQNGAKTVTCCFTDGVLTSTTGTALERLLLAKENGEYLINKVVMTDAIPEAAEKIEAFRKQYPEHAHRIDMISLGPAILSEARKQLAARATPAAANANAPQAPVKKTDGLRL
jgi:ribose-phosphate pyrophosphokinase